MNSATLDSRPTAIQRLANLLVIALDDSEIQLPRQRVARLQQRLLELVEIEGLEVTPRPLSVRTVWDRD